MQWVRVMRSGESKRRREGLATSKWSLHCGAGSTTVDGGEAREKARLWDSTARRAKARGPKPFNM